MAEAPKQQQINTQTYPLPTNALMGSIQARPGFVPRYVAVLNSSAATIYVTHGIYTDRPTDVAPYDPGVYLSTIILEDYAYTIFWESEGFMSDANNKLTIIFSDEPIFMQGGKVSGSISASDVNVVNIPTVNIGGTMDVELQAGSNNIGTVGIIGEVEISNDNGNAIRTTVSNTIGSPIPTYDTSVGQTLTTVTSALVTTIASGRTLTNGKSLILSSADSNTNVILYGDSSSQTLYLLPGQTVMIPTGSVYVKTVSGTATLGVAGLL